MVQRLDEVSLGSMPSRGVLLAPALNGRRLTFEEMSEYLPQEWVISVAGALAIERHHQGVLGGEVTQDGIPRLALIDGVRERTGDGVADAGADEKSLDLAWLVGEDFLHEVLTDAAPVHGEVGRKPPWFCVSLHAHRREAHAREPPLGSFGEERDLRRGQAEAVKRQELLDLRHRHRQVRCSNLRQVALNAISVQRERGVAEGGHDHPQVRRWMSQHRVQRSDDVGVAQVMHVIQNEDQQVVRPARRLSQLVDGTFGQREAGVGSGGVSQETVMLEGGLHERPEPRLAVVLGVQGHPDHAMGSGPGPTG